MLTSSSPAAALFSVLPNALTLEEIEKEIIGGSTDSGVLAPEDLLRHVTVSGQASSPSQGVGLPSHGVGLPSQGVGLPSQGVGLPSQGVGLPSQGVGLPSQGVGLPSQGVGLPSQGVGLPSQGVGLPMPIGTPPRSQIRRQGPPSVSIFGSIIW